MLRKYYFLFIIIWLTGVTGCQSEGGSGSNSEAPGGSSSSFWQVVLSVSVPDGEAEGGMATNRLVAGGGQTATDRFDNALDVRALLVGPVQASFVHIDETGYEAHSQQLWQDFRSLNLPAEWEMEVMADSGRWVTVSWTLPIGEVSCATHQFTLWDADGQLGRTDMCSTGSLGYSGDGQLRHFVLRVS